MKRLALILLAAVSFAFAEPTEVKIVLKGLVCSLCGQGLEKKFKDRPEVESVKVKFGVKNPKTEKNENVIYLKLAKGKTISKGEIESIVKDAGYNVAAIEGME